MDRAPLTLDRLRIGRPSLAWTLSLLAALALAAWGMYAYSIWLREGMVQSGLRTIGQGGASWGLGKSFAIHFIGSFDCSTSTRPTHCDAWPR